MIDKNILKLPPPKIDPIHSLNEKERKYLDLIVLKFGSPEDCYEMIFPHVSITGPQKKRRAVATKNSADGKDYIEKREKQLMAHFYKDSETAEVEDEKFKLDFKTNFKTMMMKKMYNAIQTDDPDAIKAGYAKLMKDFESEQIMMDPPMRILAESCSSCRYKLFVENNTEDECLRCRFRDFGKENGLSFTHKDMLRIAD